MEYIVGKPKFKIAIANVSWAIFISLLIIITDYAIGGVNGMKFSPVQITCIFIIIIALGIALPGISYCQLMWKVDEERISYTYHATMLDKIKSFYRHIFKTHKIKYQISIYLSQIDYIRVTYARQLRGPYATYGYDVLFKVYTLDGSMFIFDALVTRDRKAFNDAVDFIKSKGIQFEDEYHILDELKKDKPIAYYLEYLEETKHD